VGHQPSEAQVKYEDRPYQTKCLDAVERARKEGVTRQLIVMATGLGKTLTVGKLLARLGWPNTYGIMHREELLNQMAQTFRTLSPSLTLGIEKAESSANLAADKVILASVQTVGRKGSPRLAAVDPAWPRVILLDESHHAPAASYLTVLDHFSVYGENPDRTKLLIGMTATPDRLDELGYDKIFDDVVFRYDLRDAISDGWLADVRAWRIESDLDLSSVKRSRTDFVEKDLAQAVAESKIDKTAAETWSERCRGKKNLFFCVDKAHAYRTAEALKLSGAKAEVIVDDTPTEQRRTTIELFRRLNTIDAIVNVGVLTEGVDIPEIQNVHILRPTASRSLYCQMLGRGTRKTETKSFVEIFDYTNQEHDICSAGQIFGLPDSWELKGQSVQADAKKLETVEAELGLKVDGAKSIADLVFKVKERRLDLIKGALADTGLPSRLAWIRPSPRKERWVISWRNETKEALSRVPFRFRSNAQEVISQNNLWGAYERIEIFRNELGRYEATLHVTQDNRTIDRKLASNPSLAKLVVEIEKTVRSTRSHKITLLRKDASWGYEPSSDAQRNVLKRKGVPDDVLAQLTKREASSLINIPPATIKTWFSEVIA